MRSRAVEVVEVVVRNLKINRISIGAFSRSRWVD